MFLKFFVGLKLLLTHPLLVLGLEPKTTLSPLEECLINELIKRISKTDAETLKAQLLEVNLIEKESNPKTIISYNCIRGLSYSLVRGKKFNDTEDEYVLNKVDFIIDKNSYRAIFYVVYGNFYSVEFTSNMAGLFQTANVEFINVI